MSTSNDRRSGDGRRLSGFATERGLNPADAKVALLREAVFLVAAIEGDLQTLRLGTSWETTSDGKKAEVRPTEDVSPYDFLRWFGARAIREARHSLGVGATADALGLIREDLEAGATDTPLHPPLDGRPDRSERSTLDALVATEAASEAGARVRGLEAIASGQQARILDAMAAAVRAGCTRKAEIRRAAAEKLGITPSTLRTHLEQLKKKERQAI